MSMPMPPATEDRRAELARNLAVVRDRVERACRQAGRDQREVRLVVVTKYFPAADVRLLAELGVTDIGESRDQEASAKLELLCADHADGVTRGAGGGGLGGIEQVHFIGRLQTNKAGHVATYADVVHSVDRPRLLAALDKGAAAAGRRVAVLLQVSLDGDPSRGGAREDDIDSLVQVALAQPHLDLRGLMAVAPLGSEPDEAFARLAEVARQVRLQVPTASWVSAGMSGDLEAAVRHGATHLRVGSAILGSRQSLL